MRITGRTHGHRAATLALLALALAASARARAVEVADPPPRTTVTLALVRLSFAAGDQQVEQAVEAALTGTGKLEVVRRAAGARFIGKLEIGHSRSATALELTVLARGGKTLVRARQSVPLGKSLEHGAEALAQQVVEAIAASRAGQAGAESAGGTVVVAEVPAAAAPEVTPAPRVAPAPREEPPAPPSRSPFSEGNLPPAREPPPSPRTARADDWSGQRSQPTTPPTPRRLDFVLGAELGIGPWSADPARLIAGSDGFDFTHYAPAFTNGLDKQWRPGLNLHGGWRFLGYGAVELAVQLSAWSNAGRANLIGVRFSGYPLKALWPKSPIDLGIEIGGGHAFVASGSYDMSGGLFTTGVTAEYPLGRWFGVVAYYRLLVPLLGRFYVDYSRDRSESVGFTAYWNTFGIGVNFHPALTW